MNSLIFWPIVVVLGSLFAETFGGGAGVSLAAVSLMSLLQCLYLLERDDLGSRPVLISSDMRQADAIAIIVHLHLLPAATSTHAFTPRTGRPCSSHRTDRTAKRQWYDNVHIFTPSQHPPIPAM